MKNYNLAIFIIALFLCFNILAQKTNTKLSSLLIPVELTENANAVIRLNKTVVDILSSSKMTVKEKRVVTVLNKLGKNHIDAYKHYNDDTKITKIQATIYDSFGNRLKKYSKNDFLDVSAISNGTLYSDSRVKHLEHTPTSYPYTVVFESEYTNSSTAFIPKWFPIENYNLSIQENIYTLNNPQNIPFRKREKNFEGFNIKNNSSENNLNYSLSNQKAIKHERHSISFEDFVPSLSIMVESFSVKGINGNASNWIDLGKWEYNTFYNEEYKISEQTKSIIINLTKDIIDPLEKAKKIYEYVQNKTRYINVSVGIGGLKPVESNIVDKVGYGDCKGLTNYTRALLEIVGVKSYFAEVFAGAKAKNMDYAFPKIQGNHVILNIPYKGKDIWLECTSQTIPFGFLGDFTDNRDVLVITPEGAILKRTPAYINVTNSQSIKARINLLSNGDISASLTRISKGTQYDNKAHIKTYTKKELDKYYKSTVWDYNNNLEIKKSKLENDKEKITFTEKLDINIESFGKVRDSSYLFKLNVFNRITRIPKRYRKRERPLEIRRGFTDKDEFIFKIPEGYLIKNLPQNKNINNKFGTYKVGFVKINDTTLKYNREFSLKKGIHPKEDYKAYRKFRKTVAKYDNIRTELIKN